jgi:glycosyltransferase involved in cell wall biosynthesis
MRPRMEAHLDGGGPRDSVVLRGSRDDPEEFYAEADAFALPSDEEGMPNGLLEAMASGLPCAASDLRGIVSHGRSGLIPEGDGGEDVQAPEEPSALEIPNV